MTTNRLFYKRVAKEFFLLLFILLLCRFSGGLAAYAVAAWGCVSALRQQTARALACWIILSMLVLANPILLPVRSPLVKYALRGGSFFILLLLGLAGRSHKVAHKLPVGGLFAYLGVCAISSATGWLPQVSYMKLVLFSVFLLAIVVSATKLQVSAEELQSFRCFLLAASIYVIAVSFLLWPFPQWSSLGAVSAAGKSMELVGGDFGDGMYLNQALLCGVFSHSQALGGICACAVSFVVADMLFVEKRIEAFHSVLFLLAIFVVYQTKSRTALFAMAVTIFLITFYAGRSVLMNAMARSNVRRIVQQGLLIMLVVGALIEIRGNKMSKWLRKKNDIAGDERTMVTAITESRQGLVAKSMRDFKMNPILGMGFQVEERHRYHIKGYSGHGIIMSASIEKGLLPLMVMGESGIVGSIVFIVFLFNFYSVCVKEKLIVTGTLFTVFIAENMGEATFFSSGGPGGMEWLFTAVGGFVIDMCMLSELPDFMFPYRHRS